VAAARRIVAQREADRVVLAHALHDEAAQTLANIALHLQICERAIAVDVERGRAELAGARAALGEAIGRLRAQVFRLRPLILEEVGVGPTLRRYVGTLPGRDDLSVEVVDGLGVTRLDRRVELGLYRIAQAALDNAIAHAGASKIVVELRQLEGSVEVSVRDDGAGFDAAGALAQLETSDAIGGLRTIVEWSRALAAELELASGAEGTLVRVLVPAS
jgi:two-component system sensor histidine kinase DegS